MTNNEDFNEDCNNDNKKDLPIFSVSLLLYIDKSDKVLLPTHSVVTTQMEQGEEVNQPVVIYVIIAVGIRF